MARNVVVVLKENEQFLTFQDADVKASERRLLIYRKDCVSGEEIAHFDMVDVSSWYVEEA
jgi:hypothetical protein